MSTKKFNLEMPFPDVFPKGWDGAIGSRDFMEFRNIDHFRYVVSKISQKEDSNCGMTYSDALKKLLAGISDFPDEEQVSIRNLVRSNLHKRGLITQEVYEAYRYSTDGTKIDVDVGKYANGEPDCVITPTRQYIDFFHELYVSISYPYYVSNEKVRENIAKLLATIEELERQHIFIKITLICPIRHVNNDGATFFAAVPLFSHKDPKDVAMMSSIVNDRLLRKFFFAILEDLYGKKLSYNYGFAVDLDGAMNVGNEFNEIEFFESIVKEVGA